MSPNRHSYGSSRRSGRGPVTWQRPKQRSCFCSSSPKTSAVAKLDEYDLGQATMAMMLAAADLGIGSGHSAIGDQDECRRIIASPADRICAYMLALGYPADRPLKPIARPNRKPFAEVVHRGRW